MLPAASAGGKKGIIYIFTPICVGANNVQCQYFNGCLEQAGVKLGHKQRNAG